MIILQNRFFLMRMLVFIFQSVYTCIMFSSVIIIVEFKQTKIIFLLMLIYCKFIKLAPGKRFVWSPSLIALSYLMSFMNIQFWWLILSNIIIKNYKDNLLFFYLYTDRTMFFPATKNKIKQPTGLTGLVAVGCGIVNKGW